MYFFKMDKIVKEDKITPINNNYNFNNNNNNNLLKFFMLAIV